MTAPAMCRLLAGLDVTQLAETAVDGRRPRRSAHPHPPRHGCRLGLDDMERELTRLINIDNGGTLTDVCIADDSGVRYAKTLTTPFDLSACLFDALTKASEVVFGKDRLSDLLQQTDFIRYSTTQGTNALVQRIGPRLGLLAADSGLVERLRIGSEPAALFDELIGDRVAVLDPTAGEDDLDRALVAAVNGLTSRGANRLVVSMVTADGASTEQRVKRALLRLYPRQLLGAVPMLFSAELTAD